MASRTRQIVEKIQEIIAVDYSSGESGLNMQNKVQIGAILSTRLISFCGVSFVQATSDFGQSLGRYRITNTFEVYAFVGGANVEERTVNAMDLVEDMVEALVANRQIDLLRLLMI